MKNLFNTVRQVKPKKNVFDLSHDVKLSTEMGVLCPTLCLECVPGDSFNISCESLLRFAPMLAPVMHRFDVYMHYWFVPNRILWPKWESYITNGGIAQTTPLPAFPYVKASAAMGGYSDLADFLGVPRPDQSTGSETANISAFPFAAYHSICNEFYMDQNLDTPVVVTLADGDNGNIGAIPIGNMRTRCWEHDYFTASLPFAQKGTPVAIPVAAEFIDVPVLRNDSTGTSTNLTGTPDNQQVEYQATTSVLVGPDRLYARTSDLSADASTINDLRRAFRLQEWLEKAARGGSRYTENILSHFGVRSSDKRLQRPEYITGTKSPVVISEVLQSSSTDDTSPQGNMAGHGVAVTSGKYGNYFCEEHGYIIGIMSVMPKTAYQQGIPKHFLKINDPFELYWPSFAHLGEQEVQNQEVYAYTTTAADTFGYVPRYAEYKYQPSRVAGQFRSTLNFWHAGRIFATQPALNDDFVKCDPRTDFLALGDGAFNYLWVHILHKVRAVRPMPIFGTPSF